MVEPLTIGARVRVRRDPEYGPGPWPEEPTGAVIASPMDGSAVSYVETVRGAEPQYWLLFDAPQYDADGDGPYDKAQVLAKYFEFVPD